MYSRNKHNDIGSELDYFCKSRIDNGSSASLN